MNFPFSSKTIEVTICGDEHNDAEFREIEEIITKVYGATFIDEDWGMGGSQEIYQKNYRVKKQIITLQTETYAGISIIGPKELVTEITAKREALNPHSK